MTSKPAFLGLDGCKAGWFCIGIDRKGGFDFTVLKKIEELYPFLIHAKQILVDIPIGLPWREQPVRTCDTAARRILAPRGSSVFPAPARSALAMPSYHQGSAENQRQLNRGLSVQTWNIVPKIRETDEFMRRIKPGNKVREMHPEVAFWALNGRRALKYRKKEQQGIEERLAILSSHYDRSEQCFLLARDRYLVKEVASDDIVDAMAGAVTAMQHPRLSTLPENPEKDREGIPMEIVYCGHF